MLRASKTYKGWWSQGSWPSPLEGVAEALRGALLLREWLRCPFSPTGPFPSRDICSPCVCVLEYWNLNSRSCGPRSVSVHHPEHTGNKKSSELCCTQARHRGSAAMANAPRQLQWFPSVHYLPECSLKRAFVWSPARTVLWKESTFLTESMKHALCPSSSFIWWDTYFLFTT